MQGTTPETPEVPSGMTEEQATSALLKRMGVGEEPPPEEEKPEEPEAPEADEAKPDAEEEPEEEPSEESEEVEIDVAGEKFKVPAALKEQAERIQAKAKEVEAGATRKFQEAADLRKLAETQTEHAKQIAQLSEQEVDLLANKRMVARRLQQIQSIDFSSLADQDPVAVTKLNAEFNQLTLADRQIDAALQQTRDQSKAKTGEVEQARMTHLGEWAKKNVKGWSDDYSQTLLEFSVKELGADPTALRNVMSEPVLKALDLAYRGWKVQTTDPKAKLATSTKTLKPGAAGQMKTTALHTAEKAVQRFKKSGSVDDGAAALLARMNAKRR